MNRFIFLSSVIIILTISLTFQLKIYSPSFFSDIVNFSSKSKIRLATKTNAMHEFERIRLKNGTPNERIKIQTDYKLDLIDLPKNTSFGFFIQKYIDGECIHYWTGYSYYPQDTDHFKRDCQVIITEETKVNDSLNFSTELINFRGFSGYVSEGIKSISGGGKHCIDLPTGGIYKSFSQPKYTDSHEIDAPILAYFIPEIKLNNQYSEVNFSKLSIEDFIEQFVKPNNGFVIYYRIRNSENFYDPFLCNN